MSTVLWTYLRQGDAAIEQQEDLAMLYRHLGALKKLASTSGLPDFERALDHTDLDFNVRDLPLPAGMTDTRQWMLRDGNWLPRAEAEALLVGLIAAIQQRNVRFGWLRNQQAEVLAELDSALAFLRANPDASDFTFAVVM